MSKVVREDIDDLNARLTITVEPSDYETAFKNQLSKYQREVNMPGFRKGKTPKSFIKKRFGKPLLSEIVNESVNDALVNYLQEEKVDLLGQPIPTDGQPQIDVNINEMEAYDFSFDLGLPPAFEITGLDEHTFRYLDIKVPDDIIDEQLEQLRTRNGDRTIDTEAIKEEDLVQLTLEELGEDGTPKEGGWEVEMSILVNRIGTEELKQEFLSKKAGDVVKFNIYELEKDTTEEYVRKHLLKMNEEEQATVEVGSQFQGTIMEVSRIVPAEMNEAFFEKAFPEEGITTEEDAREFLIKEIKKHYTKESDSVLFAEVQEYLMDNYQDILPLPEDFLKRWLVLSNEENTPELVEGDFDRFSNNLRWSLIRNKLSQMFDVKVEEADVRAKMRTQIEGYFGGNASMYGEDFMDQMVDSMLQRGDSTDQIANEVLTEKMVALFKDTLKLDTQSVTTDEFGELVKALNERMREKAGLPAAEEEE